jgi:N-acetylneuraminate synthase
MTPAVDKMQLQGDGRRRAIQQCTEQLAHWDVAVPAAEPLVLDFGVGDFHRIGLIEYWIANEMDAGYCGKYLFVFDAQSCPAHSHARKHETFFVVKGSVALEVDGRSRQLNAGQSLAMPAGQVHSFMGLGPALLLEVSTPCHVEDNLFQDPRIARWLRQCVT